jgi:hypothetical protein
MPRLGRRAFLLVAVLLAPAARLRALGRQTRTPAISLDEFVRLSQRLLGRTNLDARVAATYFTALIADAATVPLLARLAQGPGTDLTPAHLALERTIIEWWYTGVYTVGGERRLATHTGSLMWAALGMPAPGTCTGPFGAWARPPRPIA